MNTAVLPEKILAIERPHPALWNYYVIRAILTGPGLIVALPYLYFRYHTLRYKFDGEGIHMKVGILFRREINLTYSRIQDIHLRSGLLQRWMGLADVQIQTASGSSGPELIIEGFKEFEFIRDFLYTRMRGYQKHSAPETAVSATSCPSVASPTAPADNEVVGLLLGIRDEIRKTRELLESRNANRAATEPLKPNV
jgi:uncharacterized membrane protein YdbT with pleckstrin-like domain